MRRSSAQNHSRFAKRRKEKTQSRQVLQEMILSVYYDNLITSKREQKNSAVTQSRIILPSICETSNWDIVRRLQPLDWKKRGIDKIQSVFFFGPDGMQHKGKRKSDGELTSSRGFGRNIISTSVLLRRQGKTSQ